MDKIINGGLCPLTGWAISNAFPQDYDWKYTVTCRDYSFNLWLSMDCFKSQTVRDLKHIVRWLLVMGKIRTIKSPENYLKPTSFLLSEKKILEIIAESFIPQTPKEKSEQFLIFLNKIFPKFRGEIAKNELFNLLFFSEYEEFTIYLDYLVDARSIQLKEIKLAGPILDQVVSENRFSISLTFHGIQHIAALEENGRNSKNCFIAMSFSEKSEIVAIKEAIKSAVNETKYHSIIINEKHIESDRTINDAIIAEIKRAKFVVADFTQQKSGVYFEAGFALGLGIPVIYCCDKADFVANSHFDVNHYPHILYNSPEELRKGLIDKIRAWID